MSNALISPETAFSYENDRPGWIPSHIIDDWDDSPYAYQTEDELMPSGPMHGQIISHMQQTLEHHLKKQDLMMLIDIFVLYRDVSRNMKNNWMKMLTLPHSSTKNIVNNLKFICGSLNKENPTKYCLTAKVFSLYRK